MSADRDMLISLISDTWKDIHGTRPKDYSKYKSMSVAALKKELKELEHMAAEEIKRPEREKKEAVEMKKKYSEKGKTSTMADALKSAGAVKESTLTRVLNTLAEMDDMEADMDFEMSDEDAEIMDQVVDFLKANPRPSDEDVHAFADEIGMDHDALEEVIYRLLSGLLHGEYDEYEDDEDGEMVAADYGDMDTEEEPANVVGEGCLSRVIAKMSNKGKRKTRLKESAKFASFTRLNEAVEDKEDNKDDIFALVEELKKREVKLAKEVAGMLMAILTHKARYKGEDISGFVSAGKDKQLDDFCAMVKRFMTKRHMNTD